MVSDNTGVSSVSHTRAPNSTFPIGEEEEQAEEEEEDEEAHDVACLWEGVALRSALGVSARAACPGASVDVARVPSASADDVDEGGVLWVRVAVDGERAFPAFAERDEASRESEPRDDREDDREDAESREEKKVSATTRVARAAEAVRSISSTPSASLAARAYLAASELAQELVAARLDQKAPAGAETAAASTIAFNFDIVAFVPMMGLSAAATTVVGQHLGAKDLGQRARPR